MKLAALVSAIVLLAATTFLCAGQQLPALGSTSGSAGGGSVTYTFASVHAAAAANSVAITGGGTGHVYVTLASAYNSVSPTCSIAIGANTFTKSPNSPSVSSFGTIHRTWCAAMLIDPPSGASTVTATWGGTGVTAYTIHVEDFTYTGGTPAWDGDAFGGSNSQANPLSNPSYTPSAAGRLLVAAGFPNSTLTSCNAPWTVGGWSSTGGIFDCYIASSGSTATSVNFTDATSPDEYWAVIAALK